MRPLLFFGVIDVFFAVILDLGHTIPHYGVYLLTGIVYWTYFAEATSMSVSCLVQREALLRKVRFPRMAVPLSVSLTAAFNLAMNFIAVIVFALASGITPESSWLWLLPIAVGFILLATGVGMLLAALYVRYRDVAPIWDVLSQILFYASPIMYTAPKYKGFEHFAMLNPLAMMLTQMGHAFIHDPYFRTPVVTAGGGAERILHVLGAILIIVALFGLGWWYFTREAPRVAEEL